MLCLVMFIPLRDEQQILRLRVGKGGPRCAQDDNFEGVHGRSEFCPATKRRNAPKLFAAPNTQNRKSIPMFCAICLVASRNCPGLPMNRDCPPVLAASA